MTKARTLADMISDGVIGTTELADDVITPVKLDETGSYTVARLGVGASASTFGIEVLGTGTSSSIRVGDTTNNVNVDVRADSTGALFRTASNHPVVFATNQTERMRIDTSGNVGIGVSPSVKFHVKDTFSALSFEHSGGNAVLKIDGGNGDLSGTDYSSLVDTGGTLLLGTGGGTERMRIDSNGNVGIGTTILNSNKVVIEGGNAGTHSSNLKLSTGNSASGLVSDLSFYGTFVSPTADKGPRRTADITSGFATGNWGTEYLAFGVGGATDGADLTTEHMRITSAGYVGIGGAPTSSYGLEIQKDQAGAGLYLHRTGDASMAGVNIFQAYQVTQSNGQSARLAEIQAVGKSGWGGDLTFHTKDANSTPNNTVTERMRILAGGGVTFNGDTATANALDDYEEGTFTPSVTIGGAAPAGLTIHSATSHYTKIGRVVTCTMGINATWSSSSTGDMRITGLPFTESRGGGYIEPGVAIGNKGTSNFTHAAVIASSNDLVCYKNDAPTSFHSSDFNNGGASGFWFHGTVVYHAT